ncbi:4Fe-4S binding protein [bacterium]|nr:4Fe-4S binding protein [bacterium]
MQQSKQRKIAGLVIMTLMALLLVVFTAMAGDEEGARRTLTFWDIWALPRVWVGALLALIGLFLLMSKKLTAGIRALSLLIIFFAFTVVSNLPLGDFARGMGLHPSPMCAVEKPFLFLQMGRAVPIVFIAILAFVALISIVGNKLFCGWNCPIGAVQELLHRIPVPNKFKIKLPFKITNAVRIVFFLFFLAVLFLTGASLYEYVNPFEFLHWGMEAMVIPAFVITFIGAVFIFRPFCYLICPLGLMTWLLEPLALTRIRLDKKKCTMCLLCVSQSPCPSVQAVLEGRRVRPDCHACGICLHTCPENALKFDHSADA